MRNYELYLLLTPKLDESGVDKSIKEIEAMLNKHGAKITDINKKGRQPMGYLINNFKDANHVLLNYEGDPQENSAIKKQLEINSSILRSTIFVPQAV